MTTSVVLLDGGCCEVGPAHIAELARQLQERGIEVVADVGGRGWQVVSRAGARRCDREERSDHHS